VSLLFASFLKHFKTDKPASSVPTLEFAHAFSQSGAEQKFGGANGHVNVRKDASGTLGYIARRDGTLALVYGADVSNAAERTMHRAFIDAHTGNVISAVNYAADASVSTPNDRLRNAPQLTFEPSTRSYLPFSYLLNRGSRSSSTLKTVLLRPTDGTSSRLVTRSLILGKRAFHPFLHHDL
jgi:hypothetical protein